MTRFTIFCFFLSTALTIRTSAQDFEVQKQLSVFASKTADWNEGFSKNTGGNEFSYQSFRNDLTLSLLTRCTTGKMEIEWETAAVKENVNQGGSGFVWIAAINHDRDNKIFDFFVNGSKQFEIQSGSVTHWIQKNPEGFELEFVPVSNDQNKDVHGYMALRAPAKWITPGKSLKIKITGQAGNSQSWIIVYQASDALGYLQNSVKYNSWCELQFTKAGEKYLLDFSFPIQYAGREIIFKAGKKAYPLKPVSSGDKSAVRLTLPVKSIAGQPISIEDESGTLLYRKNIDDQAKDTRLIFNALIIAEFSKISGEKSMLKVTRVYRPGTSDLLMRLSRSNVKDGTIYLMNSSHQDIAWMDDPEKCIIQRDTMLLTPLFEKASKDSLYRFDVEDALMLREYIQRHPDKKELVRKMLENGRISCGSAYIQPYEEMYSGEALARQFYLGARWLKKEFGYNANTYWNEDVPGRTLQMPQILAKSGTKYLMISRQEKGIFNWKSPDGSSVFTYSPGHYSEAFTPLNKSFYDASDYVAQLSLDFEKFYGNSKSKAAIPLLSDWDMSPAKDYSSLISQWHSINQVQNEQKEFVPVRLPQFEISLAPHFLKIAAENSSNIPSITGERPAVWLYIHGPSHQKAIRASREGDILLTEAEKFSAINAMIDGNFNSYPQQELEEAWKSKIYPDHGWGGKNGDITDNTFLQKYLTAKSTAEKLLQNSLTEISTNIKIDHNKGTAIAVFNSLNWKRTDVAEVTLQFENKEAGNLSLSDAAGQPVPVQFSNVEWYPDGSMKSATLRFIAEDIPSIGYKTFYWKPSTGKLSMPKPGFSKITETRFYKIELGNGGLKSIRDKELNKELIDPAKFSAGEVFTLNSIGNGAGEFSDIQKTDMAGYDKTGNYNPAWELTADGPVYISFKYRQKIKYASVEEEIIIYKQLKRIDFKVALLNWEGVLYREFRMAMPVNMTGDEVSYEVPFGKVTVGKDEIPGFAGERYKTICKEVHPRGIENWIGTDNQEFGVTLSSCVAVADYIDPTPSPLNTRLLQPILLASRHSCHSEGNPYLQTGDHYFSFSFSSHKPGWENGLRSGRQANESLLTIPVYKTYANAGLPEELSLINADIPGLIITTIKKAEDENALIIRGYNSGNQELTLELKSFKPIHQVIRTNMIEEISSKEPVLNKSLVFGKFGIETFMIR